jgi:hypothetical protein
MSLTCENPSDLYSLMAPVLVDCVRIETLERVFDFRKKMWENLCCTGTYFEYPMSSASRIACLTRLVAMPILRVAGCTNTRHSLQVECSSASDSGDAAKRIPSSMSTQQQKLQEAAAVQTAAAAIIAITAAIAAAAAAVIATVATAVIAATATVVYSNCSCSYSNCSCSYSNCSFSIYRSNCSMTRA